MQNIVASPECWEIVTMKKTGAHAVLQHVAAKSKAAADALMPLFNCKPLHTANAA
jgi:hypothetical protein